MEITTLDGQRVTIHPEAGALCLTIEGEAGPRVAWLDAQAHEASATLRQLRKCFNAVKDAADDLAIANYEADIARAQCRESLDAAFAFGTKFESPAYCPDGHELTHENTYANTDGTRGCRECRGLTNTYYRRELGLPPLAGHELPQRAWRFRPKGEG